MACSTGCPTPGAHGSYGECLRSKSLRPMWLGGVQPSKTEQDRFSRTNERYRDAVAAGLSPAAVSDRAVDAAYKLAESA